VSPVFLETLNITIPGPVPTAREVIVIQPELLALVQAHGGGPEIDTAVPPPSASTAAKEGLIANEQLRAACEIVYGNPFT
jgi:hypothetical protein